MNFFSSYGFVVISFVLFTGLVALISWWKTRGDNLKSESGYYLAGHSLPAIVVAGSLVMTDLSAEQLVGNNGQSVRVGITTFATQGLSWTGLVIAAVLLLPIFLKNGMTTLPEFFEKRYDATIRRAVSVIMLLSFILIMLPTILYAGAQVFVNIFPIDEIFGISYFAAIAIVCVSISIIGSIYAIFGGLKAIAVSDTLNGAGMSIGGLIVPVCGLVCLSTQPGGDGSLMDGMDKFLHTDPAMMNAWSEAGANEPWWPWPVLFTGLVVNNVYFWGCNQSIIQRALGAKSLAHAQKGMILAGLIDLFTPIFLVVPGIICALAYPGTDWGNGDTAFPTLIAEVMPTWLLGFMAAVIFGAILSSYNSVLNSASTLYALDIHRPVFNPTASDEYVVKIGQRFGTIITIIATAISPFLLYMGGITTFLNAALGIFNTPVLVILLCGIFWKKTPTIAAKIVIPLHIILYVLLNYVLRDAIPVLQNIHYLYYTLALFILDIIIMYIVTKVAPRETDFVHSSADAVVDLKPWKYRKVMIGVIVAITAAFYIVFSPWWLGKSDQTTWERYQQSQAAETASVSSVTLQQDGSAANE